MKKYKLLKDLPTIDAGQFIIEDKPNLFVLEREKNHERTYLFTAKDIVMNPEWFEEIKSGKVEFIHELFNKTKKWVNPNTLPVGYSWEYLQSQFAGSPKIAIPDFEALAKELYTKDEMLAFGYEIYDFSNPPDIPRRKEEAVRNIFNNWEKNQ